MYLIGLHVFFIYLYFVAQSGTYYRLTTGTAVRLTGKLVSSPGAGQSHELLVDEAQDGEVEVLGECDPEVSPAFSFLMCPNERNEVQRLRGTGNDLNPFSSRNIPLTRSSADLFLKDVPYTEASPLNRIPPRQCTPTSTHISHSSHG